MKRSIAIVVVAMTSASAFGADAPATLTSDQRAFFENKIRPVLADRCYKCHSASARKLKGSLALDTREAMLRGGQNGAILIPGNPQASKFIKSIVYTDPDLQMPPKGEKLTDQQIADLTAWVKIGAPDPRIDKTTKLTGLTDAARAHWAFQPVKPQAVPTVTDAEWVKTPVDAFILDKLQKAGLHPAPAASRQSLIRRATYDLIGLPPTYEEVQAFVNDSSSDAFEKVVDRLLSSPHYGERWGRYWLDTARYADTAGPDARYNDFRYIYAWTYRDYVINAFNSDKPYDEFLREQIAADLLPQTKEDPSRLAALGFLTIGRRYPNVNDTIAERIDTITKATQALTVACARCHDHKFDPVPTADYYSMQGILSSTEEPARKPIIREAADAAQRADYEKQLAALEQKNRDSYYELLRTKGSEFRSKASAYLLFIAHDRKGLRKNQLERIKLIKENRLDQEVYQGIRVAAKNDAVLSIFSRYSQLPEDEFAEQAKAITASLLNGSASFKSPVNPVVLAAFKEAFADHSPTSLKEVTNVYGKLFADIGDQAQQFVKANEQLTAEADVQKVIDAFDPNLVQLFEVPNKVVPAPQLDTVGLLEVVKKLALKNGNYGGFAFAEIGELQMTHPGAPACAMAVNDSPNPKDSPIFIRGEPVSRGQIVPRRYLEIVGDPAKRTPFRDGSGRLDMANLIASKTNPLTARVMVNRIWMHHFGEAFVRTPEDLGTMSEKPSHPELFDWLAGKFMEDGWSVKKMHRLIMLSSAYQQSGTPDTSTAAAGMQKDPENRLLWHANLRRLDYESLRDSMLAFTGKLDASVGGHPVNLTEEPFSYRRSVYGYIDRAAVSDLMTQFDFADPDMSNSHRVTTIVPQQALFFMNSSFTADVARKVTSRPEFKSAEDDSAKIEAIFKIILQRNPRSEEIALAEKFLATCPPVSTSARPSIAVNYSKKRSLYGKTGATKKSQSNFTRPIMNEGTFVERGELTPWEQLSEALLFMNDVSYVD